VPGGVLIGPYGWLLDLPGLIEDLQTTGEWMYDEWMTLRRVRSLKFHSNFQQRFELPYSFNRGVPLERWPLVMRLGRTPIFCYGLHTVSESQLIHATFNDAG